MQESLAETAPSTTASEAGAGWLFAVVGLGLFLEYPLALLPSGVDPASTWVKLAVVVAALLVGLGSWRRGTTGRWWALAGCGIVAAGVWLLPPGLAGLAHLVHLPFMLLVTVVSLTILLSRRFSAPCWLTVAAFLYLGWCLLQLGRMPLSLAHGSAFLAQLAESLGMVAIPIASCLLIQQYQRWQTWLGRSLALLWLLQVILGLAELLAGDSVTGTALNRNWMATTLLSTLPWVLLYLHDRPTPWRALGQGLSVLLTLYLVIHCQSRAAWLALLVYGLLVLVWRLDLRGRALLTGALVIGLLGAGWLLSNSLQQVHERDVRLPLWLSSLQIVLDHPLLGVGASAYPQVQIEYLADSPYHLREVAASHVEHPHLELLYRSVILGLPAGLALAIFWLPVLRNLREAPSWQRAAQASAILVLVHSFLDKPLVQPPTALIGLLCLGVCLMPWIRLRPQAAGWQGGRAIRLTALLAMCWAGAVVVQQGLYGWTMRRGNQLALADRPSLAVHFYQRARHLAPSQVAAHYATAAVALQQLGDLNLAQDALRTVRELNPLYDHVNRLQGRLYLMAGRADEALPYLRLDCRLYPYDPLSWQALYLGLMGVGQDQQFPEAEQALQRQIQHWGRFQQQEQLRHLTQQWESQVQAGDRRAARETAESCIALLRRRDSSRTFLDPYLEYHTRNQRWPNAVVFGGFGDADWRYWQDLAWRHQLVQQSGPLSPLQLAEKLARRTATQLSVTPEAPLRLPRAAWQAGAANDAGAHLALAWLLEGAGLPTALLQPAADTDGWQVLLRLADGWYTLSLTAPAPRQVAPADLERQVRLYDDPLAFMGRSLTLGNLQAAAQTTPGIGWHWQHLPSARAANWSRWLADDGYDVAPRDLHLVLPPTSNTTSSETP